MAKAILMMLLALVLIVYYDLHLSLAAGTNIISAELPTHEKLSFGGAGRGVRGAPGGGGRGSGEEKSPGSNSVRKEAGSGAVSFLAAGAVAGAARAGARAGAGGARAGARAARYHNGGVARRSGSSPAVGLVALGLSLWALLCQTF